MRAMAMDEFLPPLLRVAASAAATGDQEHDDAGNEGSGASGASTRAAPHGITRKILRKGSRVLQLLKGMVGSSQKIYNQVRMGVLQSGVVSCSCSRANGRQQPEDIQPSPCLSMHCMHGEPTVRSSVGQQPLTYSGARWA